LKFSVKMTGLMKKASFLLFVLMASLKGFCQQSDSLKVAQDTIPARVAKTETTVKRDNRPLKEKIAFGFGSAFWITPHETYIELAPVVAYRFPKRLITGLGYRYIYRHERTIGEDLNSWGPNVFARLGLLKRVYFWTEYEYLNTQYLNEVIPDEYNRQSSHSDSWFAGLGYIRTIGRKGRGGISVQLLYNMLYNRDNYSPYYSPVTYRVGYYF
jgi:hypothetical protein